MQIPFLIILLAFFVLSSCQNADFHSKEVLKTITFGSCNKHDQPQLLWNRVIERKPNLWIWLGDAVYGDTRIMPMIWVPSSLQTMKERFDQQKENAGYKELATKVPIIGVWDDHDYGNNNGGKSYQDRLQSQNIYLDFLDEPTDSIRRSREGTYVSYSYGTPGKIVKVILLDVRSHYVSGSSCDILGHEQWAWFKEQLEDKSANMTFVGTGLQVLSDIPFSEKWMACKSSLDRLIWLTQQYPRVMFLSGDVHFSEVNCLNVSSTGYPLYEFTSSGLTHSCSASLLPSEVCEWTLKNVVASKFRVSNVVTDLNFGSIIIDWEKMRVTFEINGLEGKLSELDISLDDLAVNRHPAKCPEPMEQPNWYWKRMFWSAVTLLVITIIIIALRVTIVVLRWVTMVVLKDLDTKIKHRLKKMRLQLSKITTPKAPNKGNKSHQE